MSINNANIDAVKKLIKIIDSNDSRFPPELKQTAIAALGQAGGEKAVEKLIKIIDSNDSRFPPELKQTAIEALGQAGRIN